MLPLQYLCQEMQLIFGLYPSLGVLISSNLRGWCLGLALIRKCVWADHLGLCNILSEGGGNILSLPLTPVSSLSPTSGFSWVPKGLGPCQVRELCPGSVNSLKCVALNLRCPDYSLGLTAKSNRKREM